MAHELPDEPLVRQRACPSAASEGVGEPLRPSNTGKALREPRNATERPPKQREEAGEFLTVAEMALLDRGIDLEPIRETLDRLAHSENFEHRVEVARNPLTSPQTLAWLVADHSNCPPSAHQLHVEVLKHVAAHPKCPQQTLPLLLATGDPRVLLVLAQRPACPSELLETLSKSASGAVRRAALSHPNLELRVLEALVGTSSDVDLAISRRSDASEDLLLTVAGHTTSSDVQEALAQNESSTRAVLEHLARVENSYLDALIARHPALDRTLAAELMGRDDPRVRRNLFFNSYLDENAKAFMALSL
jgi:ribosomal 50S subunit-associated protein YjgA (DUF615 family)